MLLFTKTVPLVLRVVKNEGRLRKSSPAHLEDVNSCFPWPDFLIPCRAQDLDHDGFSSRCKEINFSSCAENVLYNYNAKTDAGKVSVKQWYESSSHKDNMLRHKYELVGFGYVRCSEERVYWTGLYGK
jgi:hypothetical protein